MAPGFWRFVEDWSVSEPARFDDIGTRCYLQGMCVRPATIKTLGGGGGIGRRCWWMGWEGCAARRRATSRIQIILALPRPSDDHVHCALSQESTVRTPTTLLMMSSFQLHYSYNIILDNINLFAIFPHPTLYNSSAHKCHPRPTILETRSSVDRNVPSAQLLVFRPCPDSDIS